MHKESWWGIISSKWARALAEIDRRSADLFLSETFVKLWTEILKIKWNSQDLLHWVQLTDQHKWEKINQAKLKLNAEKLEGKTWEWCHSLREAFLVEGGFRFHVWFWFHVSMINVRLSTCGQGKRDGGQLSLSPSLHVEVLVQQVNIAELYTVVTFT